MDMGIPKVRHVPLPGYGCLILRGFVSDQRLARNAAVDFLAKYPGWNLHGVSGFCAADADATDEIFQTKLSRWEHVQVFKIEDVLAASLGVHPTFRTPNVTITHPDADELLQRLVGCRHELVHNPYHDNQQRGRGDGDETYRD